MDMVELTLTVTVPAAHAREVFEHLSKLAFDTADANVSLGTYAARRGIPLAGIGVARAPVEKAPADPLPTRDLP